MLLRRFCPRKAQSMTSGILYPHRIVSQLRRPTGSGGRCVTRVMNIMNHVQYHRALKELSLQGRILDIGFGNGNMPKQVLKKGYCSVYGMETSESCMIAAEWKLLPSLQQGYLKPAMGSAESSLSADACMDTIHSINAIYLWESLDKGLCGIACILKPQGTLLSAFYDKRSVLRLSLRKYGFQPYDPKSVKAALKHNGYMPIEVHEVKKEKSYCICAKRENVQERRT